MIRLIFALILLAPIAHAMGPWNRDCIGAVACEIGDRSYHVREPDDWDGVSPLPVLLHFHGWARQGDLIVKHQRISGATRRRGVLLLAPNGLGRSWDFWDRNTGEVDFAASVLADAAKRYPIDPDRIYVSGYSFGSAMAWRYVCENGNDVAGLIAVSGTLKQQESCPEHPREIRHVHGFKDTVMDFPMGPGGDVTFPVALWRREMNCGVARKGEPWQAVSFLKFERYVWDNCEAGKVTLDLHPGGHFIPHGWIARQLDELMGKPPRYP